MNDNMGSYISDQVLKLMTKKRINIIDSKILIMGFSFKENCPDMRNTRVMDLVKCLEDSNCIVDVYDPWVDRDKAEDEYNIKLVSELSIGKYDSIILAVAHDEFKCFSSKDIKSFGKDKHVLYDIKYLLKINEVDGRL